jgi:hypothetical protein
MDVSSTQKGEGLGPEFGTYATRDILWLALRVALASENFHGVAKLLTANVWKL